MNVVEAMYVVRLNPAHGWGGGEYLQAAGITLAAEIDRLNAQLAYTTAEYEQQLETVHELTEVVAELEARQRSWDNMLDAALPVLREQMRPQRARGAGL